MRRMVWSGIVLVVVGLWIWLSHLGVPYIDFSRNWPLLLVALGAYIVVRRIVRRAHRRRRTSDVLNDLEKGRIDAEKAINEIRRSS